MPLSVALLFSYLVPQDGGAISLVDGVTVSIGTSNFTDNVRSCAVSVCVAECMEREKDVIRMMSLDFTSQKTVSLFDLFPHDCLFIFWMYSLQIMLMARAAVMLEEITQILQLLIVSNLC